MLRNTILLLYATIPLNDSRLTSVKEHLTVLDRSEVCTRCKMHSPTFVKPLLVAERVTHPKPLSGEEKASEGLFPWYLMLLFSRISGGRKVTGGWKVSRIFSSYLKNPPGDLLLLDMFVTSHS